MSHARVSITSRLASRLLTARLVRPVVDHCPGTDRSHVPITGRPRILAYGVIVSRMRRDVSVLLRLDAYRRMKKLLPGPSWTLNRLSCRAAPRRAFSLLSLRMASDAKPAAGAHG